MIKLSVNLNKVALLRNQRDVGYPSVALMARIVVAAGATSKGQLAHRSAVALADRLGTPVVEFPGDHGGFMALPEQFGRVLDQVLTQTT